MLEIPRIITIVVCGSLGLLLLVKIVVVSAMRWTK